MPTTLPPSTDAMTPQPTAQKGQIAVFSPIFLSHWWWPKVSALAPVAVEGPQALTSSALAAPAAESLMRPLARAGAHDLHAEARGIVTRGGGGDHLDGTAGQTEQHRPHRPGAAPVINPIKGGDGDIRFKVFRDRIIGVMQRHSFIVR